MLMNINSKHMRELTENQSIFNKKERNRFEGIVFHSKNRKAYGICSFNTQISFFTRNN